MKLAQRIREIDVKSKVMAGLALASVLGTLVFQFLGVAKPVDVTWSAICVLGVLLVVYALSWCHGVSKNQMAALVYGVMAVFCLLQGYATNRFGYFYSGPINPSVVYIHPGTILYVVAALLMVGAVVLAMRGKSCVPAALGACAVVVGAEVCMTIRWSWAWYISALPTVVWCGALFALSIAPNRCVGDAGVQSAEQKLNLLKEKHELGILTDEQYQAQREEVLLNM